MTTKHATFTLERDYAAEPARVFAAWADPVSKARWFAGPDSEHDLDFRVGGRETSRGRHGDGPLLTFEAWYRDIVADQRIVYTSTLSTGETLATVSLTTVEFLDKGGRTQVLVTEQGTYLDGHEEPAWREQGTIAQLDALAAVLSHEGDRHGQA